MGVMGDGPYRHTWVNRTVAALIPTAALPWPRFSSGSKCYYFSVRSRVRSAVEDTISGQNY